MNKKEKIIQSFFWCIFIFMLYLMGAISILVHNEYIAGSIFLSVAVILYFQISILEYKISILTYRGLL